jgi:hypothetical protein
VAVGEPIISGETSHSSVWSSPDGRSWRLLGSDAFGPGTVVVGVAPTQTGVVALTLEGGPPGGDCYGSQLTCWKLSPPLRAWTSVDGTNWTAHDGPDIFPDPNSEDPGDSVDPILLAGPDGTLLVTSPGRSMATSRDGVTWEIVPTTALPRSWSLGGVAVLGSSFVAVGDIPGRALALTSRDGRTWTSHSRSCAAGTLDRGPKGVIGDALVMRDGTGSEKWYWCSSLNGVSWRNLPGLRPLGYMPGSVSQECQSACADGTLAGDGERMIAYRGWRTQAGWTSFDGRSWRRLTFVGHPERSKGWLDDTCTQTFVITAIGVSCTDSNDANWFGTPST